MSKEPQRTLDKVKHLGSSREPWRGLDCFECFRVPKSAEGALECLECSESLIISQSGLKMSKESQRALESFKEFRGLECLECFRVPQSAECALRLESPVQGVLGILESFIELQRALEDPESALQSPKRAPESFREVREPLGVLESLTELWRVQRPRVPRMLQSAMQCLQC